MTTETVPDADEWTAEQIAVAERIAGSHYLDLKGAEACYYAYESEAFWYRQELVSRDAIDPYADEPEPPRDDLRELRATIWNRDTYAVTLYSPNHCDMSPEYHAMRARWASTGTGPFGNAGWPESTDEPPF